MKKIIWTFKICTLILVFAYLIKNNKLDFSLFSLEFYDLSNFYLEFLLCLLMFILNYVRWQILNKSLDLIFNWKLLLITLYEGWGLNHFLPGGVLGDVYRVFYLNRYIPDSKVKIIVSIIMDKISGVCGVLVAIFFCIVIDYKIFKSIFSDHVLIILLFIFSLILLALILIFQKPNKFISFWDKFLLLRKSISNFKVCGFAILKATIFSLANQLVVLKLILLIISIMGLQEPKACILMLALCVAQLVNLIPLSIGGLGFGEAAFATVIGYFEPGLVFPYASSFLATRLINNMFFLPGAIFGLSRIGFSKDFFNLKRDLHG